VDGRLVAYARHTASRSSLVIAPADGGAPEEVLVDGSASYRMDAPSFSPHDWSSDGSIIYRDRTGGLFVLPPADGERHPLPVPGTALVSGSTFSPDGRWVAYGRLDDGHIYVLSWPAQGQPVRISSQPGASEPRWSADGRALYYRAGASVVRVLVTAGAAAGAAQVVLRTDFDRNGRWHTYAVAPDGRVLVKHVVQRDEPIIAVLNWSIAMKNVR
jgi:hypothetical protein